MDMFEFGPFGNGKLPSTTGSVKIRWYKEDDPTMTPAIMNDGDNFEISLAYNKNAKFFSLRDGKYFLYHISDPSQPYWFAGENEKGKPFVVGLKEEAFEAYRNNYEIGFMKSLIPGIIRKASDCFGNEIIRHESIYAVAIPRVNIEDIRKVFFLFVKDGRSPYLADEEENGMGMFCCSYTLKGRRLPELILFSDDTPVHICEGTIFRQGEEADNPLELKGPHIIVQMNHLHNTQSTP